MTSGEYEQLVDLLGRQFTEIDHRFTEMDRHFTEMRHDMLGHFDEVYRRFERLEQEYPRSRGLSAGSRRDGPTSAAGARSSSATSRI